MLHAPHGHVYFSLLLAYRPFPLKISKVGKNGPMVFSFTGKPKKKQETSINNYSFLGVRLTPGLARTLLMVIALLPEKLYAM